MPLAEALVGRRPNFTGRSTGGGLCMVVNGTLVMDGEGLVPAMGVLCSITIDWCWQERIPRFCCHETWVRRGDNDWHSYRDGSLCLDLNVRWAAALGRVAYCYPASAVAGYAADYLLNSAAWLIVRHRVAYENALTAWPADWPAWPHGPAAWREYHHERRAA